MLPQQGHMRAHTRHAIDTCTPHHANVTPHAPAGLRTTCRRRLSRTTLSRSTALGGMPSTLSTAASVALVAVAVSASTRLACTRCCSAQPSLRGGAECGEDERVARCAGECVCVCSGLCGAAALGCPWIPSYCRGYSMQ